MQSPFLTLFWILIPVCLLAYASWALAALVSPPPQLGSRSLGNGALTAAIESTYLERQPLAEGARALAGAWRYRLFGDTRQGAVAGPGGALFTAEELRAPSAQAEILDARIAQIRAVARAWDARGTGLVILPLPAKLDIERAMSPSGALSAARAADYRAFLEALEAAGLAHVDLRPAFAQAAPGAFFKRDTHWRPETAAAAGQQIATALGATESQGRLLRHDLAESPHYGDLLAYVTSPGRAASLGLGPEPLRSFEARDPGAAAALFEAPEAAEIVLVGTSYSANPKWSFQAALELATGEMVENFALQGAGPYAPMGVLLDRDIAPALVLWEIPIRYLTDAAVWDLDESPAP